MVNSTLRRGRRKTSGGPEVLRGEVPVSEDREVVVPDLVVKLPERMGACPTLSVVPVVEGEAAGAVGAVEAVLVETTGPRFPSRICELWSPRWEVAKWTWT
jgi:hypothetical protein